jgi:hypothetical protein
MKYLGFLLLVLSGYVMAEEVYYCSDNTNGAVGFHKKDGQYKQTNFYESKFKMKLQDDGNIVIIEDDGYKNLYLCSILGGDNERKSCVHQYTNGSLFNFNQDNGRYIMFEGFGYVFGTKDSVMTRIGTCTKF